MDLIFVRHGRTEMNDLACFSGRTDCELTDEGFRQAVEVKSLLQGLSFDGVYVSPLKRTVQTAEVFNKEYKLDDRLLEMDFGVFEGLRYTEIEKKYPDTLQSWNEDYQNYRIPGGESLEDVFDRVEHFIQDIRKKHDRVLVVTHEGVIRCALSLVFSSRDHFYRFKIDNGSVSIISFNGDYSFIKTINSSNSAFCGK